EAVRLVEQGAVSLGDRRVAAFLGVGAGLLRLLAQRLRGAAGVVGLLPFDRLLLAGVQRRLALPVGLLEGALAGAVGPAAQRPQPARRQAPSRDRRRRRGPALDPLARALPGPGPPRLDRPVAEESPQVVGHLRRRLVAPPRLLVDRLEDDGLQV